MKCKATWLLCLFIFAGCGNTDSEHELLEKLRTRDWEVWQRDGGYDLALMRDDAAKFLLQVLMDENEDAHYQAFHFLDRYYADPSILPELTNLFLNSEKRSVRSFAADLISSIDLIYARQLMYENLNNPDTLDIAYQWLIILEDERVIPRLVEEFENSKADSVGRIYAASALANFKDKRTVPVLLEMLKNSKTQRWTREQKEILEKLANISDERTIPFFLDFFDAQNNASHEVIAALSQSEPSFILQLLNTIEQMDIDKSSFKWDAILRILSNQKDPKLVPIYEKVALETDDAILQSAISNALVNMGEAGFESLLKMLQKSPNSRVLSNLATYNSDAAIDAVKSLAFDKSFPLRKDAYQALLRYGGMSKDDVSNHIRQLLTDVNAKEKLEIIETLALFYDSLKTEIYRHLSQLLFDNNFEVRLLTLDLIQRKNLTEMAPVLKKLTQDSTGSTQDAAHIVHDILIGKPQFELVVEMSQKNYEYGQPITLTYRITNVSNHPIIIALRTTLSSRYLNLEIQQPDGTVAKYVGPIASLAPLRINDYKTIQPDGEITDTLSVSKHFNLYQWGLHTGQLRVTPAGGGVIFSPPMSLYHKGVLLSNKMRSVFLSWSNTLISPKVHFNIEPPTVDQFKKMIESLDLELITKENSSDIAKTCDLLGELRNPDAIPALKKLALINLEDPDLPPKIVYDAACRALLKFSNSGLIPTWIKILDIKRKNNIQQNPDLIEVLGASGDPRAIELLRHVALRSGNYSLPIKAALAMQQLGDNSGVEWYRKVAYRKLRHWRENERENGVYILNRLYLPNERITKRPHSLRNPQFYADNYDLFLNWKDIREKTETVHGLKQLLTHEIHIIQRSAAYELAYRGDRSGVQFVQPDLHADDSQTRMHARDILYKLQSK